MKKADLKNGLQRMLAALNELVEHARKLDNQNLADITASARNKVQQLSEHPDLEMIADDADRDEVLRERETNGQATFLDQGVHPDGTPKTEYRNSPRPELGERTPAMGGAAAFDPNLRASAPFPAPDAAAAGTSQDTPAFGDGAVGYDGKPLTPAFPAPGTAAAGVPVSSSDPNVAHPGDPQFSNDRNKNFQRPTDVDLNEDGTLKAAPNSKGTAEDNRDDK